MKAVSPAYRAALRDKHRQVLLADIVLGSTTYRVTTSDVNETHLSNTYSKGMLISVGDIETSTNSNVNEIDVVVDSTDQGFSTLILSQPWKNKAITITRLLFAGDGTLAGYEVLHSGIIIDYDLEPENPRHLTLKTSDLGISSRRVAGIRSNSASQQRFYPTDTALDHSAKATKDTYWGKASPNTDARTVNIFGINFDIPASIP